MNEWISSEVGLPTSLMASWAKSSGGGRRPPSNPNGSGPQPHRAFRRPAPYPKPEERDNTQESYEEVDPQQHDYSGNMQYEGYQHQQNEVEMKSLSQRVSLYQKFYRQVQEQRKPADCVVLSVSSGSTDYPKSLGLCLQERGLSVEMLYLQAESGLTRALQDVRADGSPFCILVEQTNVSLSSCTVIIFSESLKIHRNMPKDQAMDFVTAEYGRGRVKENAPSDPADIAARSSELVDDFLEREKIERHVVPSETRQLLLLLAEGVHMYPEELGTIADYLRSRQDHAQASTAEGARGNMLPPGLGKPPPLLPTPPGPPQLSQLQSGGGSGGLLAEALADHSPSQPTPLLGSSGSYPKTKPPPLLSLHRASGPPHGPPAQLGPSAPRGPPPSHNPYGAPGPRGPPSHHVPPYHGGPRPPHGIRGPPPSLKSLRPHAPLLANPGGPPPRPNGPRR